MKTKGHCPGRDNPADLGTRGLTAAKLEKGDLWWHGPEWLRGPKEDWPERLEIEETPESTKEQKKAVVSTVKVSDPVSIENVIDVGRYSSKEKLLRVTAFVQRFAQNCKARIRREGRVAGGLTVEEILSAETSWVQTVQAVINWVLLYKYVTKLKGGRIGGITYMMDLDY